MQITIAVPTFDRREVLQVTAPTINAAAECEGVSLRVFDDCSSLQPHELQGLFPDAAIVRRPQNLGADGQIRQIMVDFLESGDDALLFLDSDLIVSEKAIETVKRMLPRSDGVLSLYNSFRHPAIDELEVNGDRLVVKDSMGNAGAAFLRPVVEKIIASVPLSDSFDWDYSTFLRNAGVRLLVTARSYVQHVGFDGANCGSVYLEFGADFDTEGHQSFERLYRLIECQLPAIAAGQDALHDECASLRRRLHERDCLQGRLSYNALQCLRVFGQHIVRAGRILRGGLVFRQKPQL